MYPPWLCFCLFPVYLWLDVVFLRCFLGHFSKKFHRLVARECCLQGLLPSGAARKLPLCFKLFLLLLLIFSFYDFYTCILFLSPQFVIFGFNKLHILQSINVIIYFIMYNLSFHACAIILLCCSMRISLDYINYLKKMEIQLN